MQINHWKDEKEDDYILGHDDYEYIMQRQRYCPICYELYEKNDYHASHRID